MSSTDNLSPPWKPGQSGNPAGASAKRRFQAALRRSLLKTMREGDTDELDQLADEVRDLAKQGNKIAATMLRDIWAREDGPLETRITGAEGGPLVVFQPLTLIGIDAERMRDPPGSLELINGNGEH